MNTTNQQNKDLITSMGNTAILLKRTEKLSSAVYMVTGLISDIDPIKWKLREKSLTLMSHITTLSTAKLSERIEFMPHLSDEIAGIVSLIEVAYLGSLISEMNADILKNEFKVLKVQLQKNNIQEGYSKDTLSDLFMSNSKDQEYLNNKNESENEIKDNGYKRHSTYTSVLYNQDKGQVNTEVGIDVHANLLQKNKNILLSRTRKHIDNKAIKNKRKDKIISIIKKKRQVTIKDISAVITDCSDKTLQRELLSLVKNNVLKKEGERRWSKYSLK